MCVVKVSYVWSSDERPSLLPACIATALHFMLVFLPAQKGSCMMLQSGRVIFTIFSWCEYLSKVHDTEEFGCATTAFALGLVHPAHIQTLHRWDFKLSLFFFLYFCLLKLSRSPVA